MLDTPPDWRPRAAPPCPVHRDGHARRGAGTPTHARRHGVAGRGPALQPRPGSGARRCRGRPAREHPRVHRVIRRAGTAGGHRRPLPPDLRLVWRTSAPRTWSSPPAPPARSCSRSCPRSTRVTGSPWPSPATRRTATSCTRLGCEVVELPCGPDTRFQPTVDDAGRTRRAGARPDRGQPGQPVRHRARPGRTRRARRLVRRPRRAAGQRRDLPRHQASAPSSPAPGSPRGRPSS